MSLDMMPESIGEEDGEEHARNQHFRERRANVSRDRSRSCHKHESYLIILVAVCSSIGAYPSCSFLSHLSSTFLVLGFSSMFVLLMVVAYLGVWIPLTVNRPVIDLSTYAPRAGPIGAAAGVATFFLSADTCARTHA